jgi:hypothetical protein
MDVPVMYYLGCGFNWLFVLLSVGGYFYVLNKTGKKWSFLLLFAVTWAVSGLSYVFLIGGASSDEWHITLLRVITYVLFTATIITSIVELAVSGKRTA